MKRFNYDENEDFQDDNHLFRDMNGDGDGQEGIEITPAEYAEIMRRRDALDLMQIDLANLDERQRLLFRAIRMLEKGFWWRFSSTTRKLEQISLTYITLKGLVDPPTVETKEI